MGLSKTWLKHIETWQSSGQSQAAYCRQFGLNVNTFSARLSDYRRSRRNDTAPALIPIEVQPQLTGPLVMHHAKGHRLELPATVSAIWLAELWRCLD
jgi:hypothetical protein